MRIATAGVRTGFAMTWFLQGVRCKSGRRGVVTPPYETVEKPSGFFRQKACGLLRA